MEGERERVTPLSDERTPGRGDVESDVFPSAQPVVEGLGVDDVINPLLPTEEEEVGDELQAGRISPAISIAGSARSSVVSEALRMREIEHEKEQAEKEREMRRREMEHEREMILLKMGEVDKSREASAASREEADRVRAHETEKADRRLQAEKERMAHEREMADKNRAFELERARIVASVSRGTGGEGDYRQVEGRMVRSLKLIPEFDERKVAEWFKRFEKKALEFVWPRERWIGLVANMLKGKALEVYDKMSVEDLQDYEEFKADILRAYELRPEAYRLQFRGGKKRSSDSYLECARYLEETFEKWVTSEEATTYKSLKELMIMEQFISIADKELVPLLKEKRFKSLKEAATWADDHVLAHRQVSSTVLPGGKESGSRWRGSSKWQGSGHKWQGGGYRWQSNGRGVVGKDGEVQGSVGSASQYSTSSSVSGGSKSGTVPSPASRQSGEAKKKVPGFGTGATSRVFNPPTCFFCHAVGHYRYNCPKLAPPPNVPKPQQKPVALLVWPSQREVEVLCAPGFRTKSVEESVGPAATVLTESSDAKDSDLDWCRPFLCKGTIVIGDKKYPVTILRDTAAKQSLCRNVTGGEIVAEMATACRGLFAAGALATVNVTVSCPIITTTAPVAVMEELPMKGVDFLLGNDLAGGRVWGQPPADDLGPAREEVEAVPVAVVTRSGKGGKKSGSVDVVGDGNVDVTIEKRVALGADGAEAGPPVLEDKLVCAGESAPDSSGSQSVETPGSAGGEVEGKAGVKVSGQFVDGMPYSATHPGGSTQPELPLEAGSAGTQSGPQPVAKSTVGVTAAGVEALSSAGELGDSTSVELFGGEEPAAPQPGQCSGKRTRCGKRGPRVEVSAPSGPVTRRGGPASALPLAPDPVVAGDLADLGSDELRKGQLNDASLAPYFARVGEGSEVVDGSEGFVLEDGVLIRRWKERDGGELAQVVVPTPLREELVLLAHEGPLAGHLGVRKTVARLRFNFWWPGMAASVAGVLKCCHTCQVVGKPNQKPPVAPLHPIPAVQPPFTRVLVDIVGPLPPTRAGNKYLLTLMDVTTRYPEAIPLRSIHTRLVLKSMVGFFTHFGLPVEVQTDRGTNFTSNLFKDTMAEWGVKHLLSSAYHPQSQGALERHHQTLKNMLRTFCMDHTPDWDEAVPYVLFAVREAPTESLGFSPNQLVFGHRVRGPLDVVRDAWSRGSVGEAPSLLKYVQTTRERLHKALEVAGLNLEKAQKNMKGYYDRKAQYRSFQPGEEVLVLLPMQGQPLAARYSGPYVVERRVGELDYIVATPDRRKKAQLCHVNMLKPYFRSTRQKGILVSATEEAPLVCFFGNDGEPPTDVDFEPFVSPDFCESNDQQMLMNKLSHLPVEQQEEMLKRLAQYPSVFGSVPGRTHLVTHDIEVGEAKPVKLPPYRASPQKQQLLKKELEYMLQHDLIRRAYSEWSSPVTLQPKPDGRVRLCGDFRKVNTLSKTDTYPLPRVDDSVDRIGAATYITKVDLMKGYWQVPLTDRAKEIASFVVNGQIYQCQVMPYGLKNAPATFQRLMDRVVCGLTNCVVYIDDVVIYDTSWEEHLDHVEALCARLHQAGLVVNLSKCEFVKARVQYLGYLVGHGCVTPPEAKVEAIRRFPAPSCRKGLQRFLGMVGYYRRFVPHYSTLLAPLTDLLQKRKKWQWSGACDRAFVDLKEVLCSLPVLRAPDFNKPFALAVDASKVGVGAVLLQPDDNDVHHPVCYFSKKFNVAQRNYSVIEQELLAIILALQHFEVYVPAHGPTVTVYSDHSPLQFLNRFKFKNTRLTRWSLLLQEYDLIVHHVKGTDNKVADCLSRAVEQSK